MHASVYARDARVPLSRTPPAHNPRAVRSASFRTYSVGPAENGVGYSIQLLTSLFKLPDASAGPGLLVLVSLALFHLLELAQQVFFPRSLPKAI
jgi:hypothetical protein